MEPHDELTQGEYSGERIQLEVKGLIIDPSTPNTPIVVLRELTGNKFLPIWIGLFEANAIAFKLDGIEPPRPLTHDLMASLLFHLNARLKRIIITDLQDNTFFAQIVLEDSGGAKIVDARPSDAIALALRFEAPIYAATEVFAKAQVTDLTDRLRDEDRLKQWLEEVDPEDLGKYTM